MTRSVLLLVVSPAIAGALPYLTTTMQLVGIGFIVLGALLMLAHYVKVSRLLVRVEDLLNIAKGYQQMAARQQADTVRLMTQVPPVIERSVKEAIKSSDSGEMKAHAETSGGADHARSTPP